MATGPESNRKNKGRSKSKVGLIAMSLTGAAAVGLSVVAFPFVSPAVRKHCLPYVPATSAQVENVMGLVNRAAARHRETSLGGKHQQDCDRLRRIDNVRKHSVIDLGSGDGRLAIAAAKLEHETIHATGCELNYWLVLYSRLSSWRNGVHRQCHFNRSDLWKTNLSKFDSIIVFGVAEMMNSLHSKLSEEMREDSHVIACRFPIDGCDPVASVGEGIDAAWLYDCRSILKKKTPLDPHAPAMHDNDRLPGHQAASL